MNLNKLREAMEVTKEIKTFYATGSAMRINNKYIMYREVLQTLITLAEEVIRLQGVMPEKKDLGNRYGDTSFQHLKDIGYNEAIDDCIMAQAGKEIVK